jgi:predicted RNA binding protein YcfA (HicA-like mRNA interferase family)
MPKKIRELKQMLSKEGFICKSGKGSHTKWYHSLLEGMVTISGKDGNDAKPYQEKDVITAIKIVQQNKEKGG